MSQASIPSRPAPVPVGARHRDASSGASVPSRRTAILVLLVLAALAAAGCARADDVTTAPATTRPAPTMSGGSRAPAAAVAPGTTPESEVSSRTTTADAPSTAPPTGGATAASIAAFCSRNMQATNDFANLDPTKDFGTYLAKLRQVTGELARLAPSTIKADVQTVDDAFGTVATADQLDALSSDPVVKAASDRVTAWTKQHCPDH